MKNKTEILKLAKRVTDLLEKEERRQIKASTKPDGSFSCSYNVALANTISYDLYEELCKLFNEEMKPVGGIKEVAHIFRKNRDNKSND